MALFASRGKTIVIVPPSLVQVWLDEMNITGIHHDIIKTTEKRKFKGLKADMVIVDECHKNIRWSTSKQMFKFIKKVPVKLFLTATSLINKPMDYYWPLKLLNQFSLTYRDFIVLYNGGKPLYNTNIFIPSYPTNIKQLKAMKDKVTIELRRDLSLEKIEEEFDNPLDMDFPFNEYSLFQKLLAVEKANSHEIKDKIKEIRDIHKKVIYFFFHTIIRETYSINEKFIDGTVPFKEREKRIQKFKDHEKDWLFVNYKSSGEGLDIPADAVCFIERTWSKALDYQAFMRAYGFERNGPLYIYYLNMKNEKRAYVSERKAIENKELMIKH